MSGADSTGQILRAATNADATAVTALVFAALREHGLEPDPGGTDADLGDLEGHYLARGGSFEVLVDAASREVIGSVGLMPCAPPGSVELRKMYLAPSWRGRGLGRLLLEHALRRARELGFTRVTLETASELPRAVALYQKAGFKTCAAGHLAARCDQRMELWL